MTAFRFSKYESISSPCRFAMTKCTVIQVFERFLKNKVPSECGERGDWFSPVTRTTKFPREFVFGNRARLYTSGISAARIDHFDITVFELYPASVINVFRETDGIHIGEHFLKSGRNSRSCARPCRVDRLLGTLKSGSHTIDDQLQFFVPIHSFIPFITGDILLLFSAGRHSFFVPRAEGDIRTAVFRFNSGGKRRNREAGV